MKNIFNQLLTKAPVNGKFYTVAIDGRAGSGKSTLAQHIQKILPDFIHLKGDDYFEPIKDQLVWGGFNDERFIEDVILPLQIGDSFTYRPYDWHSDPPITERKLLVKQGLCLERCYSFHFELEWDLKIWVETPKQICLERGVAREHLPKETVMRTWLEVWQPLEDTYIAKTDPMSIADIVIDGTKPFEIQLK